MPVAEIRGCQSCLSCAYRPSLYDEITDKITTVVYADLFVPKDEKRRAHGDEAQASPFLKRFTVFYTDQCEDLPAEIATAAPPPPPGLIEPTVEALIKATGTTFHIGDDRAFYAPVEDYVQVPPPQAYFG